MIRYAITLDELHRRIDTCKPGWRNRAADATEQFRRNRQYSKPPEDFWGEIKHVYVDLQRNKCAFCERDLEWKGEFHVEHFRPKGLVKHWPPPRMPRYSFPTGDALPNGYYLLTYHPLNYVAACGHCNVSLKRAYFPVEGTRIQNEDNPANLAQEQPLLLYPISDIDTDPEELLAFEGVIPKPLHIDETTYDNHRARVIIDFFELDGREMLRRQRARIIQTLFIALKNEPLAEAQPFAQAIIEEKTSVSSPHCNCAKSFVALYRQDPQQAKALAEEARLWLNKRRPPNAKL